ncbi:MAG: hypothetical protein GC192_24775 [Bacteroidetes bacterium]|nr:hypothetical protein [Bacteroidota bacterium]
MLRQLYTLLVALGLALPLFSQVDKPNYSLLWEISGEDLPQSCYLFGTMHLRDVRVFEFPDSVLLAIENCDAFAMEVHPDSAMSYVLDKTLNKDTSELAQFLDKDNLEDVEQMWSEDLEGSLDSLLKEKKTDILEKFLKGVKELPFTKKRPQILDLTLFGYAQDRGKKMYGLEKMEEYKELFSAYEEQVADTARRSTGDIFPMNRMIENYRKGQLDSLNIPLGKSPASIKFREELLTNRNLRMMEKIISLGQQQRIFCAVGCGHLPGDDGLLALFKEKGYQVRRVLPKFTGVADSLFEANKPKLDRIDFEDEISGYRVKLPLQPIFQQIQQPLDNGEDGPTIITGRMFIANDLRRGMQYLLMSMDYPSTLLFKDKNTAFDAVQQAYSQGWGRIIGKPSNIRIGGLPGRAIKYRLKDNIIDVQIAMRANRFYSFALLRPAGGSDSLSQQFFEEIRLLPIGHSALQRVELPKLDASASFPGKLTFKSNSYPAYHYPVVKEIVYAAADSLSAHTYNVIETIWSKYFQVENPDSFLIQYKQNLNEDSASVIRDTIFKSMPAYYMQEKDTANQYFVDHLIILHDEGIYEMLVNKSSAGDETRSWAFFNSFEPQKTWTGALLKRQTKPLIFADIISQDSATVSYAKNAINHMELAGEDLPAVFNILEMEMPWDSSRYASVHATLVNKLADVKTAEVLVFLQGYYWFNHDINYRAEATLEALLSMGTHESYDAFFKLAMQADTNQQIYFYYINRQFNNDSSLVLEHIPALMALRHHPIFKGDVYNAISSCLETQPDSKSLFEQYAADFVGDGLGILENTKLLSFSDAIPDSIEYYPLYGIVDIIGYLAPSTASSEFLHKLVGFKHDKWLGADALISLYKQGEKINDSTLESIHSNPYAWNYLLTTLSQKYFNSIPKKFLDAQTFIQGGIPALMDDEIDEVLDFKILEKRKHIYEGKEVWLYVFSFKMDEEESDTYLGICSQPKSGKLSVKPEIYNFSFKVFNGKNKEELIMEIIRDWRQ